MALRQVATIGLSALIFLAVVTGICAIGFIASVLALIVSESLAFGSCPEQAQPPWAGTFSSVVMVVAFLGGSYLAHYVIQRLGLFAKALKVTNRALFVRETEKHDEHGSRD